jgi:hypothetical protein
MGIIGLLCRVRLAFGAEIRYLIPRHARLVPPIWA